MGPINEYDPESEPRAGSGYDAGTSRLDAGYGTSDEPDERFVPSIDRELEAAFEYKLSTGGKEAVGEILDLFAAVLRRRAKFL